MENYFEKHEEWFDRWPSTRRWRNKLRSRVTRYLYARDLQVFCDWCKRDPEALLRLKVENSNKTNHERHVVEDLLDQFLVESSLPHSRKRTVSAAVRSFFKWNYEDLAGRAGRVDQIKLKPYRRPSAEEILDFVEGANLRDKALVMFVAATGVRLDSLTKLRWRDVPLGEDVPHITLMAKDLKGGGHGRFSGVEQHTFLTPRARQALIDYRDWFEKTFSTTIRPEDPLWLTIHGSQHGSKGKGMTKRTIKNVFEAMQKRNPKSVQISCHDLRRYTETMLEKAGLHPNWCRKILGKTIKGEENPYSQPKLEELREAYRKAIPYLELKQGPPTETLSRIRELEKELQQKGEMIDDLKSRLNGIQEARRETDSTMNRLFEDPEFKALLKRKLQELKAT